MSIYFYQVLLSLFGSVFLLSFLNVKEYIKASFLPYIVGLLAGIFAFWLFKISIKTDEAKIAFDIICIVVLLVLPFSCKFKNIYFISSLSFLFALGYGFDYMFISINFPIFTGELLDSLGLSNLFLVSFGFLLLALLYFISRELLKEIKTSVRYLFFAILIIILLIDRAGFLGLSLMQEGTIPTYSNFLSLIAKIIYYNSFLPIIFSILLIILGLINLKNLPTKISRSDIVLYRKIISLRIGKFRNLTYSVLLALIVSFISMYYILVASRPPQISTPQIVEPVNGQFVFDANIVTDGKLHRYAYITDDGHQVRFFLINRFKDKLAPVAVFDACSICGDMGYVKKDDNLICISCNVRIFLPSVGKAGGCNPIPMKYEYDGKKIKIELSEIENAAKYFSTIVEKIVTDPVNKKSISNTSKFTYLYYGKTYFFENEANKDEFEAHPKKYLNTDVKETK